MKNGKVTLLSAGPGALDLLTLRAARVLGEADVLLVDDLANPEIATLAPQARVIAVGKRGGCRSTPQAFIERLMCRFARRGAHVVRVKGGDALMFGRAGEEISALRRAGVPVEIVNGVSSAFAAAAGLGMSLTHRDHCAGVTFVTAHRQDGSAPNWAALAATGTTLAIYMGLHRVEELSETLLAHLDAATPAGAVQWAGSPQERRMVTSLGRLAADIRTAGFASPTILLVGGAVGEAALAAVEPSTATGVDEGDAAADTVRDVIARAA
ncbi:uroporphyrin-III C-methyltransferase [Pandoraea sp. NE5]|uniref:uroporphyrinogen-III C-methyltransferase n=1 Tax=Pandoraea sp. NE5 TaxID=2904129 RepID=UPI0021C3C5F0|nr:uroporphyrinogen-III C-methyltransferase [Pandoraea sp. NE5]BDD93138.1 uroporphyrin-III C-methyltransferase [Pandoraea sp. NE5]